MKKLAEYAVAAAALGVAGYLFYDKFLSDEAKASVENLAKTMKSAYEKVDGFVESTRGHVVEDPALLANVQATKAQWSALGY